MTEYQSYIKNIENALAALIVTNDEGQQLNTQAGIDLWIELTAALAKKRQTAYFVGNGASAMMASHMALDATKNGKIKALAFNDAAYLTAIGNDLAYNRVFAEPLSYFAKAGDLLVTISSSGNSPNIIAAITTAQEMGLTIITLSGMGPENKSRALGDLNFFIPAPTYGLVESSHQVLLHCWLDLYIERYVKN